MSGRLPIELQMRGLADDRIGEQIDTIKDIIKSHTDQMFAVTNGVWRLLARIVDETHEPADIQTDCILSTMIMASYLQYRALDEYERDGWTLCRGDIPTLLKDIQYGDEPKTPILRRFWWMTQPQIMYHPLLMRDLILNMRSTSGISRRSEKYHAALKNAQRKHPQGSSDSLQLRALLTKAIYIFLE